MKTKEISKKITYWLGVVAIGLLVGLSLQFVRAWTEPAQAPPGGNVGAPINTGGLAQTKTGSFLTNGFISASGLVQGNRLCIGADCRASWPSGGGGGTILGSGTANYIPKWTNGTTLGNSIMLDQGANGVFISGGSGGAVTAISTSAMAAVYGLNGGTGNGVTGWGVGGGYGVYGNGNIGIYGQGSNWAGYFAGKIRATTMTFGDGTVQSTAATAPPPPLPPPPADLNACSCVGTNTSLTVGSSPCWTSYSGQNSNFPHCGMICTPAGWKSMAPCGSYY